MSFKTVQDEALAAHTPGLIKLVLDITAYHIASWEL